MMEMTVTSLGDSGDVELTAKMLSKQVNCQRYQSISELQLDVFLRACGWCCRIDMDGFWIDVEDAVEKLGMFEFSRLPKLTHGICKDCFADMLEDAGSPDGRGLTGSIELN